MMWLGIIVAVITVGLYLTLGIRDTASDVGHDAGLVALGKAVDKARTMNQRDTF